ncbi:17422_t:CDS:2 [Cetraspora pellucida]|uniref:DNA polymerase delta catalytic subunit n=1 Tax=Cetraspora pellucida TaxID=1433469 RepID=A0A9N9HY92_9GLOM|nr:17422_t:CDS:2 [Cetraspora pellucida]
MNQEKKTITDNYHIYDSGKVKCKLCTEFFDTFLINTMKAHIETQHREFYLVKQAILLLTCPQVSGKETLSNISKLGITSIETEENSKKEDDYVYMIQFDIIFYSESISQKRFCLSTIPINSQKFHSKYDLTELIFIELQTQEQLLLKFAELVGNYEPEFEISYNTGQFDWNFILKKARLLNIDDEFIRLLTKTKTTLQFNIQQVTVRVVDHNIDKDNLKYKFAGININNRKIKILPNETMKLLKCCGLSGKIDLPYVPTKNSSDLQCIFVYINVIKFKNNNQMFEKLSDQLSKLINIPFSDCFNAFQVSESILEDDYVQRARIACVTISNVFTNGIRCLIQNLLSRYASSKKILVSSRCKGIVEQEMYDGGLVIPPIKNIKRPVADVDFTSYYPHAIYKTTYHLKNNDKTKLLYYTSLSYALKIFANSVYGETGYRYSSLYHKEVALSVTAFCRATLKIMIDFVKEQGFIYFDRLLSKKEYWKKQIKLTILHSKILETKINEYLKQIIKSTYLKMAYEKTMYLFLIFGKKHYVVITHSDVPNLDNLNLLLKGLKTIKHNVPEFYKLVAKELIYSSLGFNKDFSIRQEEIDQKELVIQIITNYVNKKETLLDLFVLTAKFDPTYASVSAVNFVRLLNKDLSKEEQNEILKQITKSDTKKENKMVNCFIAKLKHPIEPELFYYYVKFLSCVSNISHKMILTDHFAPKKDTIDIVYYFYSLQDIVAHLLGCEEKQALKKIKKIFDAEELKKQQTITEFFVEENQQKITDPSTPYKWNIQYCPKNIWIDIDKDGSRFSYKLRLEKQLYVKTNYLKNFKRTLIFADTKTFYKYGKSRCQNCKSYTYCETQGFTFFENTESDCKKVLKKLVQSSNNNSYLKYSVNVCEYCDLYLTALY